MLISLDDPRAPDVLALLEEHLADMYATSPPESVHALAPDALTAPTSRSGRRARTASCWAASR